MAGSKHKSGTGTKKKKNDAANLSSGASAQSTAPGGSPPSVTRKGPPPQYLDRSVHAMTTSAPANPQPTTSKTKKTAHSPGSQSSGLRRNNQQIEPFNTQLPPPPLQAQSIPEAAEECDDEAEEYIDGDQADVADDNGHHQEPEVQLPLEALLNMEGRVNALQRLDPFGLDPKGTWFDRDKGEIVNKISRILQAKFDGPYYNWSATPTHVQDRYFVQLAHRYTWDHAITPLVREHFDEIAARRLRGMINYVRKTRKCPNWIGEDIWKQMEAYWETEAAKIRSQIASKNSTSDPDGLGVGKHTSGPKSHEAIRRQMAEEEGRDISFGEVFIKTHKRKDGCFVDEKSRRVAEVYDEKLRESLSQISMASDGASNTVDLTVEEKDALYVDTAPKNSRGTPYGLGRLAKKLKSNHSSDSASSSKIVMLEEKLKDTETKMEELRETSRKQLDVNNQQLAFVMRQLKELNPALPTWQPVVHHSSPAVNRPLSSSPPNPLESTPAAPHQSENSTPSSSGSESESE